MMMIQNEVQRFTLLPIIANQTCILSDANSVGFRLGFSKSLSSFNTSDELEIFNKRG